MGETDCGRTVHKVGAPPFRQLGQAESVHIIATETKAMRGDVNDITERVDEIEKRPTKRYETVVTAIITAIVGGLIGYFVKMLGF